MTDNRDYTTKVLLALSCVEELAYKKKASLLEIVGDPSAVEKDRTAVGRALGEESASQFFCKLKDIDGIMDDLVKRGVHWVSYLDDEYPDSLRQIEDRPVLLFIKGNVSALNGDCVAVVGSRKPTRYGLKVAEEFAREFSRAGLVVVSGFARGIDATAHKACLACGNPTVAVFACGLDVCYPAEHKGLLEGILMNGGAIVSEYPIGTKPLQYHFPERNRIISGLCRAVFLAEAAKRSGSLITMRLAIEQGKDIFVVPGNIFAAESEGANGLLREMPHALAISPEDVLDALHVKRQGIEPQAVELSLFENQILEALHDEELHFEELLSITGLSVGELTNTLFNLELNGLVQSTGGNYYALAGM